jgi:hypothetical protein
LVQCFGFETPVVLKDAEKSVDEKRVSDLMYACTEGQYAVLHDLLKFYVMN